jgi:hypothetical protein
MTTKKRLLLIALPLIVVAVTFGVLAMLPPRPGVTKANFDRIEKGMTQAEVEERFFGVPVLVIDDGPRRMTRYEGPTQHGDAVVRIMFDENGRVFEKLWWGWTPETFSERLKRWIQGPSPD